MSDAARKEIHALVDNLPVHKLSRIRQVLEEEAYGGSALEKAEGAGLVGALGLPTEARADLARRLLESLDSKSEEGVDEAWAEEIGRRVEIADSDRAEWLSWDDARTCILAGDV